MNDIVFGLLQAVLVAMVTAIARYLIPGIIQSLRHGKYTLAAEIVESAVRAAEQMIRDSGKGEEKYTMVLKIAHEILPRYGIDITDEQISVLIESAVQIINAESGRAIEVPVILAGVGEFDDDSEKQDDDTEEEAEDTEEPVIITETK